MPVNKQTSTVLLLLITSTNLAYALKEASHSKINLYIAKNQIDSFLLDSYVKESLGFGPGIKTEIAGSVPDTSPTVKTIAEWLAYGGEQEDRPGHWTDYLYIVKKTRSLNHFHNPLQPFAEAGLDDMLKTGDSSVVDRMVSVTTGRS
jgi:hypothetical protein